MAGLVKGILLGTWVELYIRIVGGAAAVAAVFPILKRVSLNKGNLASYSRPMPMLRLGENCRQWLILLAIPDVLV